MVFDAYNDAGYNDVTLNGDPLQNYGALSLLDYSIGETPLEVDSFTGKNRTTTRLLDVRFLARQIELGLVFYGATLREAKLQRSRFNGAIFGDFTIYIPDDGFYYHCYPDSFGEEKLVGIGDGEAAISARIRCHGFRQDSARQVVLQRGDVLYCPSTMPRTDCKLTVTSTHTTTRYFFGGGIFQDVTSGDVLLFDGIAGKIQKNGADYAGKVTWTNFPFLRPGENTVYAYDYESIQPEIPYSDAVTVEYSPTYI